MINFEIYWSHLKKNDHVTCRVKRVTDLAYIEEKTGPVRGNLPEEIISGV